MQPVAAWNLFGHECVAYVAYQHLKPEVRERANALLKLNPMYQDWLKQCSPAEDTDEQIFVQAATFPDLIKMSAEYKNDDISAPEARQNIGYADKNMHKYWHYCDIPFTQDHMKLPSLASPNAEEMIPKFTSVLKSDASDDLKSYDLCWILHIVGDVHQPLHCINRACKYSPKGDNGGNDVKLCDTSPNLHHFIDDILGPDGSPISAVTYARTLQPADQNLAAEKDSSKWIAESHDLAIKQVYQRPIGHEDGPYELTSKYKEAMLKLSRERVELAGERLANLLNENLK
jgi:hypothetical protein